MDFNSYIFAGISWNFDMKSCFVVFFHECNEWKNPKFNFSSQNLSIEHNFFKWDEKVTKIWNVLFHRIWKKRDFQKIRNFISMMMISRIFSKSFRIYICTVWIYPSTSSITRFNIRVMERPSVLNVTVQKKKWLDPLMMTIWPSKAEAAICETE